MLDHDPPPGVWRLWRPLWRRRAWLGGGFIGLVQPLLMLLLVGGGYSFTLEIAKAREASVADTRTLIDGWFGPTPWALAVYLTLWLYFPLTMALAPRTRAGWLAILFNLQAALWLGALTFVAFLVFPTFLYTRAEMETRLADSSGWIRAGFDGLYALDAPYNCWPSLHVSLSLLMLLTAQWLMRGRFPRALVLAWWPAWGALLWSILATKQHHAFDIWTGALAGAAVWRFYLKPRLESVLSTRAAG